MEINT